MSHTRERRMPWKGLGLAAFASALLLTPGHLATPDAHLRLAQARNLVTHGSLAVPEGVGNPEHGNLARGREGNMYSAYNPGHILLLAPVYAAATVFPTPFDLHPHYAAAFGASFLGVFAHFLAALLLCALLVRMGRPPSVSLAVAGLFAFATVSLPLAADGYDHVFEALALLAALYFAIENRHDESEARPLMAGLALGVGALFRYPVLLAVPGVLWIVRDRRARLLVCLGLVPPMLVALGYNYYRFGSPWETGYVAAWRLAHGEAIGTTWFQLAAIPSHLLGLLASPGKGLLWFAPIVALVVPGWGRFRRQWPRMADGLAVTACLYLVFYAGNFAWHGSVWAWGPRYVVPVLAPILVALAFLPNTQTWSRILLAVGVISLLVQIVAVTADHRRYLLTEYTREPSGFEHRLLHEPEASPLVGQLESAAHVVRRTVEGGSFEPFIAAGPWRSEARPASIPLMLEQSIDLNVVDLWWVRLRFFSSHRWLGLVGLGIGVVSGGLLFGLTRSAWHRMPAT